jgi:hypothetical protein
MNVQRGFFRVWIVLSALWVAVAIESGYGRIQHAYTDYEEIQRAVYRSMSDEELLLEFKEQGIKIRKPLPDDFPKGWIPEETSRRVDVLMPDGITVKGVPLNIKRGKLGKEYTTWQRYHFWQVAEQTLRNAVSFPAISIIIWLVGVWIFSGFKTKKLN